jgi:hypothetical protein
MKKIAPNMYNSLKDIVQPKKGGSERVFIDLLLLLTQSGCFLSSLKGLPLCIKFENNDLQCLWSKKGEVSFDVECATKNSKNQRCIKTLRCSPCDDTPTVATTAVMKGGVATNLQKYSFLLPYSTLWTTTEAILHLSLQLL